MLLKEHEGVEVVVWKGRKSQDAGVKEKLHKETFQGLSLFLETL